MPVLRDVIIRQEQKFNAKKDEPIVFRAVLCDSAGLTTGSGSVWADQNERLVWCRPLGVTNAGQVRCVQLEPELGLGVLVGVPDGSNELEVIMDDPFLRRSGSGQSYLAPNGRDFEPGGRLQMWLYPEAFVPLATLAGSGLSVTVVEGDYEDYQGVRQTFAGRVNFDISSHQPAGPTEHCLVGIYISSAGVIGSVAGATVATSATAPEPSWPAGSVRLAVVDLDDTQTTINFAADIDNRRLFFPYPGVGWPFPGIKTVSASGGDYDDLQAAIDGESSGMILAVEPGNWGDVAIDSKDVTVLGLGSDPRQLLIGATVNINSVTITTTTGYAYVQLLDVKIENGVTATASGGNQANLFYRRVYAGNSLGDGTTLTGLSSLSAYDSYLTSDALSTYDDVAISGGGSAALFSCFCLYVDVGAGCTLQTVNPLQTITKTGAGTFSTADRIIGEDVLYSASPSDEDVIKWNASTSRFEIGAQAHTGDNLLYNSLTYNLWQLGSSFTDQADDSYVADLWNLVHNASTPNRPDVVRTTPGVAIPYGMNITAKSNCLFGILQFIKAKDTYPLRGKTVSLSFEALSGSGISNLRAAVLAWGSTADSLTSDVVGTWGTGNPTLATNWNYLNTPASSIAITSSLAQYTVENISISTASNNLAIFIWTPDTEANTDTVTITRVKLEEGAVATAFVPRNETAELLLVEPFIQKSYNLDTAPGTNTNLGLKRWHTRAAVAASTAGNLIAPITFQSRMRADPTVTLYAQDGTAGAISNLTTATVRGGCTAGAPGETGFAQINVDNSDADAINLDNHLGCHYLARAEL